ncbi:substrate-binding domain-containing protein [Nocardiopsis sp. HNM0947]|uniref:Substrate-binding domain-containing protein n=1 Tax=Nocardiopsis coralli TaxID=2772213 RepID=A0ABR9P5M7_9ACTN|nr:substrate-binding domain-containing protein [Nocardiopsis coralli]MBE2999143.1 substrate-binding domain-containing protein [Nocardiopsis coralli]
MHVPRVLLAGAAGLALVLSGCTGDASDGAADGNGADLTPEEEWFDQEEFDRQLAQRDIEPEGPEDEPWMQAIEPEWIDTSEWEFDDPGEATVCFSNASVSNPWRVTGFITMEQQVEALQEAGEIGDFQVSDASDDDNQQISDIQAFVDSGDCDAIIISPSTTATMTPAVETACESGVPVVVFDRGVNTDCAVTFIHPIGGYAYGADAAEFLVDSLEPGSRVLALRILPGVDSLEHRWAAAQTVFDDSDLEIIGYEFTDGDGAQIKDLVSQHLQRGAVDGIWMDAGDGAVAGLEAFEDAGQEYPVVSGEDELSFMRKWQEEELEAIAPVYSNFQWRTPVLAASMILQGEEVPEEWVLPQEAVTEETRDELLEVNSGMPSLHYARFGGEDLPGFPEAWEDR